MCTRNSLLAVVGAAILGVLVTASAYAWNTDTTYLTFNAPVALPGVTLPPGAYEFVTPSESNKDIVQVLNRNHSRSYFMGITVPVERPRGAENRVVTIGEAAPGQPAPIKAWFPRDQAVGHLFVYSR
jgi:hypothetical protein